MLGKAYVCLDTLNTVVTEVEAIINDRPLTYVSSDGRDPESLCPSHLLHGRRLTCLPYPNELRIDSLEGCENSRSDICRSAEQKRLLIQHFWKRWTQEYLTSLREFHRKSGSNKQFIKIGDVVLIQEESPRMKWKLGVIEELVKGKDDFVRSAKFRTKCGITTRPI